jgi:hypothetical protein
MSYHNGSVWPHDNALIALGLAKYGLKDELDVVFRGLFEAATSLDLRRLPELICGFTRRSGHALKLVAPVCRGRRWLGRSRSRAAACADVSGIASWPARIRASSWRRRASASRSS